MSGPWREIAPGQVGPWRRAADPPGPPPPSSGPTSAPAPPALIPLNLSQNVDEWEPLVPLSTFHTILSGSGAPHNSLGEDGDFYIDIVAWVIYGPRTNGAWISFTSITGPAGSPGSPGAQGPIGPEGPPGTGSIPTQSGGYEFVFNSPAATWTATIPVSFFVDRKPVTYVITSDGQIVLADVVIDGGQVTVIFSQPQTGRLILA